MRSKNSALGDVQIFAFCLVMYIQQVPPQDHIIMKRALDYIDPGLTSSSGAFYPGDISMSTFLYL